MTDRSLSIQLSDGGHLSVSVRGDLSLRTPILLSRPLGGCMQLWGAFAEALATERPIIMFDPRGVGRSSDPPLVQSTRAMARDAIELLDALAVRTVHVFGLSLGAMVASWIALEAPRHVARLALGSLLPSARALDWRDTRVAVRLLRALLARDARGEVALLRAVLSPQFCREQPERLAALEDAIRACGSRPRNLVVLAIAAARHDSSKCLERIRVPTKLLIGARDPIADLATQRVLLERLPHASLEIIPDSGHDLSLEQPQLTAARVLTFLNASPRNSDQSS
jgi:3-oxoadipate enol-lactonase